MKAEEELDELFTTAFETNHPAMLAYAEIKIELKRGRMYKETLESIVKSALHRPYRWIRNAGEVAYAALNPKATRIEVYDALRPKERPVNRRQST